MYLLKAPTSCEAMAAGRVRMLPETFTAIQAGNAPGEWELQG